MAWRNPVTSLPADSITSGTFGGAYTVTGSLTLAGDPLASHIQADGKTLTFYAADGVTPLLVLDTVTGAGEITAPHLRTAASGQRVEINSAGYAQGLQFFTGNGTEVAPGTVGSSGTSIVLNAPSLTGQPAASQLQMSQGVAAFVCSDLVISMTGASGTGPHVSDGTNQWPMFFGTKGLFTGTTDANGRVTVTHGLGKVPSLILTSPASPDGGAAALLGQILTPSSAWSSSTFTARLISTVGGAMASTAGMSFSWVAIP